MIEITEEDLAQLIAEGVEQVLDELHGKGSLEKISSKHNDAAIRSGDKMKQVERDHGGDESDEYMSHGIDRERSRNSRDRARALIKVRDSAKAHKDAKVLSAKVKAERI